MASEFQTWDIEYGGMSKEDLLMKLSEHKISLNAFATLLFLSERFETSPHPQKVTVQETSVQALGFEQPALYPDMIAAAAQHHLFPCPLEFAPYLRLAYLAQEDGPYVHVASFNPPTDHEPRGFYLRNTNEHLWLRGYRASDDWLWALDSRLVFVKNLT